MTKGKIHVGSLLNLASLVWASSVGKLYLEDNNDCLALLATGYSGAQGAQNDPDRQDEKSVGPIPTGVWHIGSPANHPRLGPLAFDLEAAKGTETYGRSAFYIHGDNKRSDGTASTGCIILDRQTRELIARLWLSGVRMLRVESGYRDGFPMG